MLPIPLLTTLPRSAAAPLHPDAVAYAAAIAANGGTIRSQDLAAFSAFAGAIASIRSKVLHYSPVAGDNLAAARVKFYRDSHEGSNLLTFNNVVAADYSPALGFQAGAGRHIDSGFTPNLSLMSDNSSSGVYSAGAGCWISTAGSGTVVFLGARHNSGPIGQRQIQLAPTTTGTLVDIFDVSSRIQGGVPAATGFLFGNANGNSLRLFDDGTQIGSGTKPSGGDIRPNVPVFFGAFNNAGTAAFHADARLRHFVLTLGMTNMEAQTLSTAIATLQAVLAS